jgi:type I restriction enzyme S subunit
MSWPTVTFETLYAEPSRNGVYKSKEHHGTGVKIVNMGELFAYDVIADQEMNRLRMDEVEMKKSGLSDGDLLFGRRSLVESGAGKCSLVEGLLEPTTFESSIIRVRLDQCKTNPRFYYYWFKSHHGKGVIHAIVTGTNVKGITGNNLKRVRVVYPPLKAQSSVASKLRVYDSLIENNRRRIQLLEQAARLLYKEWFIRLRFPGHEHVKIKDDVPEGWEKKTAFDAMEVLSGGTPKTGIADYWDGDIPFFTPKDITNHIYAHDTEKTLTENGLYNCNSKLYPKDTIFITARGTVGNINIAQTDMAMNQSCYALIAKPPLNQYFLYFALVEGIEQFRSRAVGAVFDAIIRDTFKLIPFVVPTEQLVSAFTDHVSPIIRQIDIITSQTRKLVKARDILLPRLMNGDIAV